VEQRADLRHGTIGAPTFDVSAIALTEVRQISAQKKFVILSFTLTYLIAALWSYSLRADEVQRTGRQVIFENATPEMEELGKKIIDVTANRFEKKTGKKVGNTTIYVQFVETTALGDHSRTTAGKVQGVTIYRPTSCTIQISTKRSSTFGRVLAHEVTHVFVREVFGKAANSTLNEGFAEYLAAQEYPSEVKRDMKAAASQRVLSCNLKPYVEGHQFCERFADDVRFPEFFASQISSKETSGYQALKQAWDNQKQ